MVDSELSILNISPTTEQPSLDEVTPVVAVVTAVATVSGADPTDLPPLNNVINAGALNNLVKSDHDSGLETV